MRIKPWSLKDATDELIIPSRVMELWEVSLQHGEETPTHQHESREELLIALEGRGEVQREDGALDLFPGHVVVVPAGTPFSLQNRSGLPMRGLLVAIHRPGLVPQVEADRITAGDLESMIESRAPACRGARVSGSSPRRTALSPPAARRPLRRAATQ